MCCPHSSTDNSTIIVFLIMLVALLLQKYNKNRNSPRLLNINKEYGYAFP